MKKEAFDLMKWITGFLQLPMKDDNCAHEGETGDYCGKCGINLREISSYECPICELKGGGTVYAKDDAPAFCRKCGAPKFLFRAVRRHRKTGNI